MGAAEAQSTLQVRAHQGGSKRREAQLLAGLFPNIPAARKSVLKNMFAKHMAKTKESLLKEFDNMDDGEQAVAEELEGAPKHQRLMHSVHQMEDIEDEEVNYLKSVVDTMCTSYSAPDGGGFHLFRKNDDDKDTQSDGDVCDMTEVAEQTIDRREGKRRAGSSARGLDVRHRTKNLGPMGTPEGGGGAEAAISTAAGSIAGQLHGMVASMDKFQTAHMEVRRAEVAARELEVKSGVSKSKLETIQLAFSMGALTKDEMIAQVKAVMALQ
jgi:hypothetical protein